MIRVYTLDSLPQVTESLGEYIRPYQLETAFLVAYVPHSEAMPPWLGERSPIVRGGREVINVRVGDGMYDKIVIFHTMPSRKVEKR